MRTIKAAVITGPTGAIGQALCRRLLREGVHVYAVCHRESSRLAELPVEKGFNQVLCNLEELTNLPMLIDEPIDVFFHLAWACTTGYGRNNMQAQVQNIQYTLDACRAAKELGCSVFVGAGSQAEYGRVSCALTPETPCFPENGYGMAKLCAGQMSRVECAHLGIDHVWPRVLSVYGPHDGAFSMISSVIRTLLAGEKPALTAGEQMWDYLYADDAAEAFYLMARYGKDGAVYPLGGGKAQPLREYIEALRNAVDPSLALGLGEVPYSPRQVMYLQADISALYEATGFAPKTSFAEGIQATVQWAKEVLEGE